MKVADVRDGPGDALAVELHDDTQRRVGRGVLGPEVQRPAVAGDVLTALEIRGRFDVDVDGLEVVGHGRS